MFKFVFVLVRREYVVLAQRIHACSFMVCPLEGPGEEILPEGG